jgi:hypothetical protein
MTNFYKEIKENLPKEVNKVIWKKEGNIQTFVITMESKHYDFPDSYFIEYGGGLNIFIDVRNSNTGEDHSERISLKINDFEDLDCQIMLSSCDKETIFLVFMSVKDFY